MILGVAIYTVTGDIEWIMFPLVLRSFGVFATIVGLTSVPFFTKEDGKQDPMTPLNYGYYIVSILSVVGLVHHDLRPAGRRVVLVLRLRHRRYPHRHRLRLHHPVLHGRLLAAGARRSPTRPAPARRRTSSSVLRSASRRRPRPPSRSARALVASFLLGSNAGYRGRRPGHRRHLRHRRRDDGHADVRRLHPGDGHLRPDYGQRRWHHGVLRRSRERP